MGSPTSLINITILCLVLYGLHGVASANQGWENGERGELVDMEKSEPRVNTRKVDKSQGHKKEAVSIIHLLEDSSLKKLAGILVLEQKGTLVTISGELHGLPSNTELGFHVHESGDFRNETNPCDSTGPHFNPNNRKHGGPQNDEKHRHVGDLGNIKTDGNGVAKIFIQDSIISIGYDKHSILGRAFVVHQGKDDLGKGGNSGSMANGNSGKRIACGSIGTIYHAE